MIPIGKLTKTMSYPKEKMAVYFWGNSPSYSLHNTGLHYAIVIRRKHARSHVLLIVNAVFFVASNFYWKLCSNRVGCLSQ